MGIVKFTLDHNMVGYESGQEIGYDDKIRTFDDGAAFLVSQLAAIESRIYMAKYAYINFEELVPLVTDGIPEGANEWAYMSADHAGDFEPVASTATDFPTIRSKNNYSKMPLIYGGAAYEYSLEELRASSLYGTQLDTTLAQAAFRTAKLSAQKIVYSGNADRNTTGLFNDPEVSITPSAIDWNSASAEEIAKDVNDVLIKVYEESYNVHVPDTLVLSSNRFTLLTNRFMTSTVAGTPAVITILNHLKQNNLATAITNQPLNIFPRKQLEGAGAGGNDRLIAYELNDENLGAAYPIIFRALEMQFRDAHIRVPCESKVSGAKFRYAKAAAYKDFSVPLS